MKAESSNQGMLDTLGRKGTMRNEGSARGGELGSATVEEIKECAGDL